MKERKAGRENIKEALRMEKKDDFLRTPINWAVVIRADLPIILKIKEYLASVQELEIIYQAMDTGKLLIVKENQESGRR